MIAEKASDMIIADAKAVGCSGKRLEAARPSSFETALTRLLRMRGSFRSLSGLILRSLRQQASRRTRPPA
jgi:hypothetical protein